MRRALVFLPALLVLAGCGAQRGGDLEGVDSAMAKTGTSRVEMKVVNQKRPMFTATGLFDYEHKRGEMVLKPSDPAFEGSSPFEGRFIGRTTYSGWLLLGKKRWLKESDNDEAGGLDQFVPGPGGPSPDRVLGRILKMSKRVETLGNEEIRGVEAKHYRAHLDPKRMGEQYVEPKDPVIEVWVDEEGLLRRLRVPMGPEAPEITVDFFDYGVDVDIQPPSKDELVTQDEFDKLMAADCKLRKEKGERWDESECTREGVAESGGGVDVTPVQTVPAP